MFWLHDIATDSDEACFLRASGFAAGTCRGTRAAAGAVRDAAHFAGLAQLPEPFGQRQGGAALIARHRAPLFHVREPCRRFLPRKCRSEGAGHRVGMGRQPASIFTRHKRRDVPQSLSAGTLVWPERRISETEMLAGKLAAGHKFRRSDGRGRKKADIFHSS